MDKRDAMRDEIKILRIKHDVKANAGLNSVEECREEIRKIYEQVLTPALLKEKEDLFEKIQDLQKKIKSLELDNDKYRRKKEKYSKEFEDLKTQNSINLKNLMIYEMKLEKTEKDLVEEKQEVISLKAELRALRDYKYANDKLQRILYEENKVIVNENDSLRRKVREFKEMSIWQRIFYKGE